MGITRYQTKEDGFFDHLELGSGARFTLQRMSPQIIDPVADVGDFSVRLKRAATPRRARYANEMVGYLCIRVKIDSRSHRCPGSLCWRACQSE